MGKKELIFSAFAALMLGLVAYLWFSPSGADRAPDVQLTTLDGKNLRLADLRGKPVLVTFWATSCPGCVQEMPHMVELYRDLHPKGFELIGVAMEYDPPEQVREMAARRNINYPVAIDGDGAVARAFGNVRLTPTHFLIDPEGRIVQQKLGELDMAQLRARVDHMLKGDA